VHLFFGLKKIPAQILTVSVYDVAMLMQNSKIEGEGGRGGISLNGIYRDGLVAAYIFFTILIFK
jgi:hypothetical protein